MFYSRKYLFIHFVIILGLFIWPFITMAANLNFQFYSSSMAVNETMIADFKLTSDDQIINAIDGEISFDNSVISIEEISTGGSIFTIWPRTPVFSNQSGKIFFSGGTPNGIKQGGTIFKIIFTAKDSGQVKFNIASNTSLYLNDGRGTKVYPNISSAVLDITTTSTSTGPDIWQEQIAQDKIAPIDLQLEIGQDKNSFDGKYFLSISAKDEQSGLDHFEVKEGNGTFVHSESPYVIKDQSLKKVITVLAFDRAGNVSSASYQPNITRINFDAVLSIKLILAILALAVIIVMLIKIKTRDVIKNKKR